MTPNDIKIIFQDLLNNTESQFRHISYDCLNEWETTFANTLRISYAKTGRITDVQYETLVKIYDKVRLTCE